MQKIRTVTLKQMAKQESDKLAVFFYNQRDFIMHKHDCFELAYVVEGNVTQTLGGKTETLQKGAYFIIDHESMHDYTNCQNLKLINCLFMAEIIDATLTNCNSFDELMKICLIRYYKQYLGLSPVNRVFYDKDEKVLKILKEMIEEYDNQDIGYQELFRGKLLEILILTMREVVKQHDTVSIEQITDSSIVREAVHYFEANYQDKALLNNFCQKYHYNAQYISRLFKKETSLTVLEYIQRIRIKKSCQLLTDSKLTIREIAHLTGYDDVKFFNRIFLRIIGMTPSEYRKKSN